MPFEIPLATRPAMRIAGELKTAVIETEAPITKQTESLLEISLGRVRTFVGLHGALLAHLKDAAVVKNLFEESAFVLKVINVIVLKLVEERQPLLDPAIELRADERVLAAGKAGLVRASVLVRGRDLREQVSASQWLTKARMLTERVVNRS